MLRFISLILAMSVVAAFGAEPTAENRIMSPTNAPVGAFPFAAQLLFSLNSSPATQLIGSGTLIAPNVVLTAGHCTTGDNGTDSLNSMTVTINGVPYLVSHYLCNPTWNGQTGTEGVIDASLIFLTTNVVGVPPVPINRIPVQAGQRLTLVGFGQTGDGVSGEIPFSFPPAGTVNFGVTTVGNVGFNIMSWPYLVGQSTTAHGDSGGPSLLARNNVTYIAGICSAGTDPTLYGTQAFQITVNSIANWIDTNCNFTNLTATGSVTAPSTAIANHPISITSSVVNEGYVSAPPFVVRYRLSTDTNYHDTDVLLGDFTYTNGLPSRTFSSAPISVSCPNVTPGNYFVVWKIDALGNVAESDRSDDVFFSPLPITIAGNSPPVFDSDVFASPNPAVVGDTITLSASATDPDGDPVAYTWDFGDGTTGVGSSLTHNYGVGTFTATVFAIDGFGGVSTSTVTITVGSFLSLFAPTPNPAVAGEAVKFKAIVTPGVFLTWDFGDKSPLDFTLTPSHVFLTSNANIVTVTAKKGTLTATAKLRVNVIAGFRGHLTGSAISTGLTIPKKQISLNFKSSFRDSLTINLDDFKDFSYFNSLGKFDKNEFAREVSNADLKVFLGATLLDDLKLSVTGKSFSGKGKVQWNPKKGEIVYSLKNTNLKDTLQLFGVTSTTTSASIALPITFEIAGVDFGTSTTIFYTGKAGGSGRGK